MKNKLFVLLVVFVFFWLTSPVLAGSTRVTKDGIQFPDGTTQTTSSTGGSGLWSANGFKIYYSSGNVGIGINDPNERLEVEGNIEVSGTGNGINSRTEQCSLRHPPPHGTRYYRPPSDFNLL